MKRRKPVFTRPMFVGLSVIVFVQVLCSAFFILELATEVLGLRTWTIAWEIREALQIGASLGLLLGALSSVLLIRAVRQRMGEVEDQVRAASGFFLEMMDRQFLIWNLSPSEREVALFAIRGYSNREIAKARGKSEATVKTQLNAVFRKAEVAGRPALISHFIDLLIAQKSLPNI